MSRCTAHMATFCSCRFKRDTLSFRLRTRLKTWWRYLTPQGFRGIDFGDWP